MRLQKIAKKWLPWILLSPVIAVLLLITIYPFVYGLYMSFNDYSPISGLSFCGIQNYIDVIFSDARFHSAVRVTVMFITITVGAQFLLGLGIALLLHREFLAKRFMVPLVYTPMLIAPVAIALIWRMIYNLEFGPLNYLLIASHAIKEPIPWVASPKYAFVSVAIADIWQWTPFMFLVMFAGLQCVPPELIEVAKTDGASTLAVFRHITLPFLIPSIVIGLLIRLMDAFKIFDIIYVLTRGGPGSSTETMSFLSYQVGFKYFNLGYAAAMSIILYIMILIICQFLIKGLRGGR